MSPALWWLAAGIGIGALEMLTFSTYLLWPAAAAILVAALMWAAPGVGLLVQLGVFALLCIVLALAGRPVLMRRTGKEDAAAALNRPGARLAGRLARVESFAGTDGKVTVDGVPWPARTEHPARLVPGSYVRVLRSDGIVLWVSAKPDRFETT